MPSSLHFHLTFDEHFYMNTIENYFVVFTFYVAVTSAGAVVLPSPPASGDSASASVDMNEGTGCVR